MYLPMHKSEMRALGWDALDVILVSGDAYIDAPQIGAAVIGRVLVAAGYRVGVIAQPDPDSAGDISRLGAPRLFWGVTAGSVDSMVANYTALRKKRRNDDYTPGGENTRRPDRACIVYSNLIRRHFKQTAGAHASGAHASGAHASGAHASGAHASASAASATRRVPIVLGGLEASLRRIAHYDYWSDRVRRSLLFDAKADAIIYGMGERTVLEFARRLRDAQSTSGIPGTCEIVNVPPEGYLVLPSFEEARDDAEAFIRMYALFYDNTDPVTARGLAQRHGDRWLVQHPPPAYETQEELDAGAALPFQRDAHPSYQGKGALTALDTIRFSLQSHRGCYGECNFCAIAVHEGRRVRWRSERSLLAEAAGFARHPRFRGVIPDVGGPTANMYGFECTKKIEKGACSEKRCLYPDICRQLPVDHHRFTRLLERLRQVPGVRHVFVASGIRHDMVRHDQRCGQAFMEELVRHHVSGQLKLAPEHSETELLDLMGKGGTEDLLDFRERFFALSRDAGKKQFLTYYFIAAYPGSEERHMHALQQFAARALRIVPEQVQIFTPTPGTWASVMYHTGRNPFTGEALVIVRTDRDKQRQKDMLTRGIRT